MALNTGVLVLSWECLISSNEKYLPGYQCLNEPISVVIDRNFNLTKVCWNLHPFHVFNLQIWNTLFHVSIFAISAPKHISLIFCYKARHEISQLIPLPKSWYVIHHMIRCLLRGVQTNPKSNQTNSWDGMPSSVSNIATSSLALGDRTMLLTSRIYEIMIPNP